jgi:hypothetical protein
MAWECPSALELEFGMAYECVAVSALAGLTPSRVSVIMYPGPVLADP